MYITYLWNTKRIPTNTPLSWGAAVSTTTTEKQKHSTSTNASTNQVLLHYKDLS